MTVGCEKVRVFRLAGSGRPWASALTKPTAPSAATAPAAASRTTANTVATRKIWPRGVRAGLRRAAAREASIARDRGESAASVGLAAGRRSEPTSVVQPSRLDQRPEEAEMLDLPLAPARQRRAE